MQITPAKIGSEIHAAPGERLADCDPDEVVALVEEHAWVHFIGFDPALEEFEEFTHRFGRCTTPRAIHYPPGGVALGFHAEDSYNAWRPDTLWFVCLAEGTDGGTPTGVVDGVQLFADLDEKWQEFSRANALRFDRTWPAEHWQKEVGTDRRDELAAFLDTIPDTTYEFLPDGSLHTRFEVPMVVRTRTGEESFSNTILHAVKDHPFYGMSLADGSEIPQELVEHVEQLALERELKVGWAQGEVLVIDNYRLMHRRGEYGGTGRDLRALHGEEFFGSKMPEAETPLALGMKRLLQGDA